MGRTVRTPSAGQQTADDHHSDYPGSCRPSSFHHFLLFSRSADYPDQHSFSPDRRNPSPQTFRALSEHSSFHRIHRHLRNCAGGWPCTPFYFPQAPFAGLVNEGGHNRGSEFKNQTGPDDDIHHNFRYHAPSSGQGPGSRDSKASGDSRRRRAHHIDYSHTTRSSSHLSNNKETPSRILTSNISIYPPEMSDHKEKVDRPLFLLFLSFQIIKSPPLMSMEAPVI